MKIIFLGVGEACDERLPNTSLLLVEEGVSLLMDCGFTGSHVFFKGLMANRTECWHAYLGKNVAEQPLSGDEDFLDAIYISHFHGDHFFGLPLLLLRLYEQGRSRPLKIIGQNGLDRLLRQGVDLAYPNLYSRLGFDLEFIQVKDGDELMLNNLDLAFAATIHPRPNLALRVRCGKKKFFYSGDGQSSPCSRALARGCELVVHEAFSLDRHVDGHGSVHCCLEMAKEEGVSHLALVHMQREQRRKFEHILCHRDISAETGLQVSLPAPGLVYTL